MNKATIALLLICATVFAQQKGSFTDSRDKKTYKTVRIGEQVWMAENLNYNAKDSKCYGNNSANCAKYGRLYDFKTVNNACPSGWHLPSDSEWEELSKAVGGAAKKLKAKSGWNNNGNGTDELGFSALPGGSGSSGGGFGNIGNQGLWWRGGFGNSGFGYRVIYYNYEYIGEYRIGFHQSPMLSIRCLQDEVQGVKVLGISGEVLTDSRDGKEYKTIKIGEQTWMAENLNYDASDSKCYENDPNCQKYGRLYDWNTAVKEACPSGWHLPSKEEWGVLDKVVGGEKVAGIKLKAESGWNNNGNGTDEFGFSALSGGGDRSGVSGVWWSSSKYNSYQAYSHILYYNYNSIDWGERNMSARSSVRCLRDKVQPNEVSNGVLTDSRDGKKYKSVKIGEQTWMAENLNYEVSGSKCFKNDSTNCTKYGRLYNWSTAKDACPSGWHLPSKSEWEILDDVGGEKVAGKKQKAKSGWNKNGNGTDDYGFSALPGGGGGSNGNFFNLYGDYGYWWSSSEYNVNYAYSRWLIGSNEDILWSKESDKYDLFSVRCIQDEFHSGEVNGGVLTDSQDETDNEVSDEMLTDSRDGKKYKFVKIGKQIWMAENLNYNASGSKCYDNKPANCTKYGRLYNWSTAKDACPSGWHLPSYNEWEALDKAVGGIGVAGKKLKAKSDWNKDGNGTDEFGFSALPGGNGYPNGNFYNADNYGLLWSSSEGYSIGAYGRSIGYNYEYALWHDYDKSDLFSVRCVQDQDETHR